MDHFKFPIVQGPFYDWMASDNFKIVELLIMFGTGAITLFCMWQTEALF